MAGNNVDRKLGNNYFLKNNTRSASTTDIDQKQKPTAATNETPPYAQINSTQIGNANSNIAGANNYNRRKVKQM